jgi:hypothetical protein
LKLDGDNFTSRAVPAFEWATSALEESDDRGAGGDIGGRDDDDDEEEEEEEEEEEADAAEGRINASDRSHLPHIMKWFDKHVAQREHMMH